MKNPMGRRSGLSRATGGVVLAWEAYTKVGLNRNRLASAQPPTYNNNNKMLSYRRETALQCALQLSPKVEDWNWETIFYGHYRSIFNHCDIIGLKICRIP